MVEIVMPQLSDSMDEGKLIAWKVHEGQEVHSGDVIAEVESDKAIMEVQTFNDGVVKELLTKEDATVPVGTVIARIAREGESAATVKTEEVKQEQHVEVAKKEEAAQKSAKKEAPKSHAPVEKPHTGMKHLQAHAGTKTLLSPKARVLAGSLGIDTQKLRSNIQKEIVHAKDVDAYLREHYFTPKAQHLLQNYHLQSTLFRLDHKIDAQEVEAYIQANEIPLPVTLSSMQKAIIANVTASAQKPIYHIYESVDASKLQKDTHSITVWLVKIVAKVMMQHDAFRSQLLQDAIKIMPNANISIAVANEKELYMPVIKDANKLTAEEIQTQLKGLKAKLQNKSFSAQDMQGSTFGISNLGMLGVSRFDAMINKDDSAILAVGAVVDGKISLTLTVDHRLVNGYEAALFMRDLKQECMNETNFKG
jgi:pyruvate dehydrogenase E2 component (dihydrolipoamide acetyltransferase)